jgi:hypothetical protein
MPYGYYTQRGPSQHSSSTKYDTPAPWTGVRAASPAEMCRLCTWAWRPDLQCFELKYRSGACADHARLA